MTSLLTPFYYVHVIFGVVWCCTMLYGMKALQEEAARVAAAEAAERKQAAAEAAKKKVLEDARLRAEVRKDALCSRKCWRRHWACE